MCLITNKHKEHIYDYGNTKYQNSVVNINSSFLYSDYTIFFIKLICQKLKNRNNPKIYVSNSAIDVMILELSFKSIAIQ